MTSADSRLSALRMSCVIDPRLVRNVRRKTKGLSRAPKFLEVSRDEFDVETVHAIGGSPFFKVGCAFQHGFYHFLGIFHGIVESKS